MTRMFEYVKDEFLVDNFKPNLPKRSTSNSAGYDFFSSINTVIFPGEVVTIWTNIKAKMQSDEVLKIYIRSSVAKERFLILKNSVAIIDSDYYGNPNTDGNIGLMIWNVGKEVQIITENEKIAQGIFEKYLIVDNDNIKIERQGGFGSTNL